MFLSPAGGMGLLVFLGLSVSSSVSSSSSSSASSFSIFAVFGSVGMHLGGETGESSSSPSSTLLRPFIPDECLGGGVEDSGFRPGEDKSSGRIGLSIGNGLSRPKCLSDKKDKDSDVRTKCSSEDSDVAFVPALEVGNAALIMFELVVEDTEEGLDGSSSLSSLLS